MKTKQFIDEYEKRIGRKLKERDVVVLGEMLKELIHKYEGAILCELNREHSKIVSDLIVKEGCEGENCGYYFDCDYCPIITRRYTEVKNEN